MRQNFLLGELLIDKKLITQDQLDQALAEQKISKEPVGQILIRFGFLKESNLRMALSEQLGVSFLLPDQLKPRNDQRLKELISPEFARQHHMLPLEKEGRRLRVAVTRIPDLILMDNLRKMTGHDIVAVMASESELQKAIDLYYSATDIQEVMTSSLFKDATLEFAHEKTEIKEDLESTVSSAGQAPVVKLVDLFLKKALDDRASDIHIEPSYDKVMVRYRIDGILHELPPPPKELHSAVISRIKILSKLDIAEKRVPQDGSFAIQYQGRKVDIRVSTIPIVFGEKVVMRLLDKRPELLDLKMLGFEPSQLQLFENALWKPHGLVLVTGPTGSGKSTTLYAALNKRFSPEINILTIEDPVEYQIPGISQVQVKPDIGLTFASGLRAFLRQDPDVILVGEVRDLETAEICIRASLTGHMVLTTLHTNDASTAVTRLVDIGIQSYLVASSLVLIIAQRLVRMLCPQCKEPHPADPKIKADYNIKTETLYKAKGCKKCRNIGYWGRVAIYEMLPIDEDLRRIISKDTDLTRIRQIQREKGYPTLLQSGVKKVEEGITTLDEVLSVAYE